MDGPDYRQQEAWKRWPPMEDVLRRVSADFATGRVYWVMPPSNRPAYAGKEAGGLCSASNTKRYWYIVFGKTRVKRADVIYCLYHRQWPTQILDHINGDSTDDSLANLREALRQQNIWNMKRKPKRSGWPAGVRRIRTGRFEARITCGGKTHTIGYFDSADEASVAYQAKRREFFGEFA